MSSSFTNQWQQKRPGQPQAEGEQGAFYSKSQGFYHVQPYWDPETNSFKMLDYSKPPAVESEVLGFKVVHNGNIIHDEMPEADKNSPKEGLRNDAAGFTGLMNSKFNEMPLSETISMPSFIEA